jgi:DNA-binding MarR family transcriptional regulator
MGAASQLVDRMVEQKLASRRESRKDRRVRIVEITRRGRALLHRLHAVRHREWTSALARIPLATRSRLHAVMRDVIAALGA